MITLSKNWMLKGVKVKGTIFLQQQYHKSQCLKRKKWKIKRNREREGKNERRERECLQQRQAEGRGGRETGDIVGKKCALVT